MDITFKKSSLNEMCKQIKSAPVVFRKNNGKKCLAFYNNENPIKATKLYIMFPDSSIPKYIEGNSILNLSNCIYENVTIEEANSLYNQINKAHKTETVNFITNLIQKSLYKKETIQCKTDLVETKPLKDYNNYHTVFNKRHSFGWVKYKNKSIMAFMKDLFDKTASELITEGKIEYNANLDCVYWASSISSKEFTDLKVKMKEMKYTL